MLDGPFGAVCFLFDNLANRQIEPKPGWWISSGAITGVHEIASGDIATAQFNTVGSICARVCTDPDLSMMLIGSGNALPGKILIWEFSPRFLADLSLQIVIGRS